MENVENLENKSLENTEESFDKNEISNIIKEQVAETINKNVSQLNSNIEKSVNSFTPVVSRGELGAEFKSFLSKAMTTTSDPVLVPPQYSSKIVEAFGNYGIARRNANVETLNSNTLYIPRVTTSANPTAYYLSEGSSSADSKVDTQTVTLSMKALQTEVRVSKEMLNTTGYDILGLVQRTVGRQFAITEDTAAFMGNANPFTGLFNDSGILTYTQSASGSINNMTYKDLVDMEAKLDPQFRIGAKWVFDPTTFAKVKGLLDTQNRPIFESGVVGGVPTIMNYPYEIISSGVLNSTSVTASGTKYFALVNMKEAITIGDNQSLEVLVDPYSLASSRQVKYVFTLMNAIGIANPNAGVIYKIQ